MAAAKQLISEIVDPSTGVIRTASLLTWNRCCKQRVFRSSRCAYGPPGGRQLFFRNGRVVVRLKTKGDERGFRATNPIVSCFDRRSRVDWFNELAKFNRYGQLAAKAMDLG